MHTSKDVEEILSHITLNQMLYIFSIFFMELRNLPTIYHFNYTFSRWWSCKFGCSMKIFSSISLGAACYFFVINYTL